MTAFYITVPATDDPTWEVQMGGWFTSPEQAKEVLKGWRSDLQEIATIRSCELTA